MLFGGIHIHIPKEAEELISILERNGYEAYLVGGCVRDALMGRIPKDYDICTSALPEQVIPLFDKTIPTGLKHGTVTVILRGLPIEVTTFRADKEYTDHRRPDAVVFTGSLREDLQRRDFTMNALAYHPEKGIIDPFGGLEDMQKKLIKTVGDPHRRFGEDALRMLRAIRFKARFGFSVHESVLSAIRELAETISYVSRERILSEMNGILLSPFPEEMTVIFETGLSNYIFPNCVSALPALDRLKQLPEKLSVRWAALLKEIGLLANEELLFFCQSLKMSNALIKDIAAISGLLHRNLPDTGYTLRKAISEAGIPIFCDALSIAEASGHSDKRLNTVKTLLDDITAMHQCVCPADLAVNGGALIQAGFQPGKDLGALLDVLFICVLQKPELNNRELLLDFARQIKMTHYS